MALPSRLRPGRETRRRLKLGRVALAERVGSRRYSRPALNGLDRMLLEHVPDRPGFFVEAGANDGYTQSNTYFLERHLGWSGLLVEPAPHLAATCRRVRPRSTVVECALVSPGDGGRPVRLHYADLMSLTPGARGDETSDRAWVHEGQRLLGVQAVDYLVPGMTLGAILDELDPPAVDLLSLDVEGNELNVLAGLGRWRPTLLLVEVHDQTGLLDMVGDAYEVVARPTHHDVLLRLR